MTDEVESTDDIPQGDGPYEKGLWAEARHWVGWLVNLYGNVREIALVGISRRSALRLMTWLWSIEGIVRRLILAAALALDPESLKPRVASRNKTLPRQQTPEPEAATEPQRPPSTFRVLGLHGRPGAARGPQASERAPPPEHRHLVFPVDDLLRIGAALARPPARPTQGRQRHHPLDRRGRVSRWDPCYSPDPEEEAEGYRRYFFGPFRTYSEFDPPPVKRERNHRDIHDPYYRGPNYRDDGGLEHRRIEAEWERKIPAPGLAGRIMALHRVMADPARWIERTARLIQSVRRLPEVLRSLAPPRLEKPRRDRGPAPPGLDILERSHAALVGPDTS